MLDTSDFGVGVLRPLVSEWLSDLGGKVRGKAAARWDHIENLEAASVTGDLVVRDAFISLPQLGQQLHTSELHLLGKDGRRIEIEIPKPAVDPKATPPRTAADVEGAVTAKGEIDLEGLALRRGHVHMRIPGEVPVTFEGVQLGNARGEVDVTLANAPERLDVAIVLPNIHLELPSAPRLGVQSLDDAPDIRVTPSLGEETKSTAASGERTRAIAVTVQANEIHIEGEAPAGGKGLDLVLRTRTQPNAKDATKPTPIALPTIQLGDKLSLTGEIEAERGKVDVYGKLFELDQGFVRLREEDPSNPYVNVLAHWDAPDGSRITVGYNGPLLPVTDEKLILRSEPPRAGGRQAILTALLFGVSPGDTTQATTTASTASTDTSQGSQLGSKAVGVGGGLATAELSALLSGTLLRGLSARFGTTAEGALATTLQYQVGQKVIAAATFENPGGTSATTPGASTTASGTTSATTQTAATRANRTEISVDWRFAQQWSLRATLGVAADQPTSGLDLLWQYRY